MNHRRWSAETARGAGGLRIWAKCRLRWVSASARRYKRRAVCPESQRFASTISRVNTRRCSIYVPWGTRVRGEVAAPDAGFGPPGRDDPSATLVHILGIGGQFGCSPVGWPRPITSFDPRKAKQ
jgi:hypothetical protein